METGGNDCVDIRGASTEIGCYQFTPGTYKQYANEILGYVPPMTEINTKYIAAMKVQEWLDKGRSEKQIFLAWNGGEAATKCKKGVNKHKVKYDSCQYIVKAMNALTAYAETYEN